MTSRTDAAGTSTFAYQDGRLSGQRDGITGLTQTLGYDLAGQPNKIDYGGGRIRTVDYDDLGRPSSDVLKNGVGAVVTSAAYAYDDHDRTTAKNTTGVAGAGENSYGYDYAGRLTSWTFNGARTDYAWDAAGNRTSAGNVSATFDERNRRVTDGTATNTYTARGTLATRTDQGRQQSFEFDAFDRLTAADATRYSYDGLGRVFERDGTRFAYSGSTNELTDDGTTRYARGPGDELLGTAQGINRRVALSDIRGDVIGGFDPAGELPALDDSTG